MTETLARRHARLVAAASFGALSSISHVAIRMTWTALPITSAGRFSPLGPLGMRVMAPKDAIGL
jgi:hypothetical protein